ncbi:hypothetical protein M5689_020341 [Euphorbia peplus]|nr:hypothetical protein M5689_020341 [Euphorbia peplus]
MLHNNSLLQQLLRVIYDAVPRRKKHQNSELDLICNSSSLNFLSQGKRNHLQCEQQIYSVVFHQVHLTKLPPICCWLVIQSTAETVLKSFIPFTGAKDNLQPHHSLL